MVMLFNRARKRKRVTPLEILFVFTDESPDDRPELDEAGLSRTIALEASWNPAQRISLSLRTELELLFECPTQTAHSIAGKHFGYLPNNRSSVQYMAWLLKQNDLADRVEITAVMHGDRPQVSLVLKGSDAALVEYMRVLREEGALSGRREDA